MQRFIYTLKKLWQHRSTLKQYCDDSNLQTKTIFHCSLKDLKKAGIEILVLDYDGVLAGHAVDIVEQRVEVWLESTIEIFGEGNVFILSNLPTEHRRDYFTKRFTGINFVTPSRKKPYPDGLLEILTQTQVSPEAMLVVDDRLWTGILGSISVGARGLWVTSPTMDFTKHPIQEVIFVLIRKIERILN